jgi:hypothetical protein
VFRIYYSSSEVDGETREDWIAAPDDDVQVVVLFESYGAPHLSPWSGVWDRKLWTGEDLYSLNDWPVKLGRWMDLHGYREIWDRACIED